MVENIALALLSLSIAAFGTYKSNQLPRIKASLIALAIIVFGITVFKANNDESDKMFLQRALISNLNPSNSSYEKLCEDVHKAVTAMSYNGDIYCHHSSDGMISLLSDEDKKKHATVVFNKLEIAEMYAYQIKKSSNQKVINEVMQKSYEPKSFNEEFLDKVGGLDHGVGHPLSF